MVHISLRSAMMKSEILLQGDCQNHPLCADPHLARCYAQPRIRHRESKEFMSGFFAWGKGHLQQGCHFLVPKLEKPQALNSCHGHQWLPLPQGHFMQTAHRNSVHFTSIPHSSNSLWPHGLQHARLPCSSKTLRICSNTCLSSGDSISLLLFFGKWWCHPTLSSSVMQFSCLQSFQVSGFLHCQFFASVQFSHSVQSDSL